MKRWQGVSLVAASVLVSGLYLIVASQRELTSLEGTLLQFVTLAMGTLGSYALGRESTKEAAKEVIKPHARSAFRRLLSLYESLSRLAFAIQQSKLACAENTKEYFVLDKLDAVVNEQISTADDALEDWKDIIPEELEKLKKVAGIQNGGRVGD
jgi:hypothetical protein